VTGLLLAQAAGEGAQAAAGVQAAGSGAAEFWVFWLVAPLSLAAAASVVVLRNPVHAALMLVVNFFTFAIFYAVLQGQFLATIQVIVYAGAIMILFLFVLMLLGVDREAEQGPGRIRGQRVAAVVLGVALFVALAGVVAGPYLGTDSACNTSEAVQAAVTSAGADALPCAGLDQVNAETADGGAGGNVAQIGRLLFGKYVWPFEVTSVLLVIASIGAIVLGKRKDRLEDLVDVGRADPPSGDPQPAQAALEAGHPVTGEEVAPQ
jgi:NADH-quinone oxidoreductase subunit J